MSSSTDRPAGTRRYFDVELADPVVLPVLRDDYRRVLEGGGIRLARDGARLLIEAGERRFPVDPRSAAPIQGAADPDTEVAAINADPDALDGLLDRQHYRLASWRAAHSDLRYRRFFDVNDLIGLRIEHAEVFAEVHRLVLSWVEQGPGRWAPDRPPRRSARPGGLSRARA